MLCDGLQFPDHVYKHFILKYVLSLVYKYEIKLGGDHILLTEIPTSVQTSPWPSLASATPDFPVTYVAGPAHQARIYLNSEHHFPHGLSVVGTKKVIPKSMRPRELLFRKAVSDLTGLPSSQYLSL